jgi:hypothetical protein
MPLEFDEFLTLKPIPTSPRRSARQAALIQRRLAMAGGDFDLIRSQALAAINRTSPEDEPAEEKRLRLLYKEAYTQEELAKFVESSLVELGFGN